LGKYKDKRWGEEAEWRRQGRIRIRKEEGRER
jgi:hypothetical protein